MTESEGEEVGAAVKATGGRSKSAQLFDGHHAVRPARARARWRRSAAGWD